MTNIQIVNFLDQKITDDKPVTIYFKSRNPVIGLFIKTNDFEELKTKNLWRIVGESKLNEFKSTKDTSLARIFNGVDFIKMTIK